MLYKDQNYQIMKYTTPYSHQRQQILARILLTLWLPIMCSPEPTLAAPRSGSPVSEASTSSWSDLIPRSSGLQGEPPQAPNVTAVQLLHAAVEQGDLAQVQKILEKGKANINAVDDQRQSALHRAIIQGHTEIAALLLETGADLQLKDLQSKRPLDYNEELGAIAKVMQLLVTLDNLIKANLDEDAQNKDKIEQKQDEVGMWLSKLERAETQGQEQHQHFKYRYHVLQASYYKALGDEANASHQETLATKHKKPDTTPDTTGLGTTTPDADEIKTLLAKIAEMNSRLGKASASTINDEIQKILKKLKRQTLSKIMFMRLLNHL